MRDRELPILLVDDDRVDVKTVQKALRSNQVTNPLRVAATGAAGLEELERISKDGGRLPCLILLDINMPGMSGLEVLDRLKADARFRHIPVILLTTSKNEYDRKTGYGNGAAGYIVKPVDFERFVEAVRAIELYWSLCEPAV